MVHPWSDQEQRARAPDPHHLPPLVRGCACQRRVPQEHSALLSVLRREPSVVDDEQCCAVPRVCWKSARCAQRHMQADDLPPRPAAHQWHRRREPRRHRPVGQQDQCGAQRRRAERRADMLCGCSQCDRQERSGRRQQPEELVAHNRRSQGRGMQAAAENRRDEPGGVCCRDKQAQQNHAWKQRRVHPQHPETQIQAQSRRAPAVQPHRRQLGRFLRFQERQHQHRLHLQLQPACLHALPPHRRARCLGPRLRQPRACRQLHRQRLPLRPVRQQLCPGRAHLPPGMHLRVGHLPRRQRQLLRHRQGLPEVVPDRNDPCPAALGPRDHPRRTLLHHRGAHRPGRRRLPHLRHVDCLGRLCGQDHGPQLLHNPAGPVHGLPHQHDLLALVGQRHHPVRVHILRGRRHRRCQ
eukprot:comp18074_c0_seq1/m.31631 comp18074_c0_seq1/g.31631  ORF comp18074_c0_seq1/g.31631 comp18074_c0_seq1/m.31631 type:complete len:409 (+) comp18074_c0_seq1:209-1435(+)